MLVIRQGMSGFSLGGCVLNRERLVRSRVYRQRRPKPVTRLINSSLPYVLLALVAVLSYASATQAQGVVTYQYDEGTNGTGRLTSMYDSSGSARYSYDNMGRITRSDKTVDNTTYTIQTGYDALGRLQSITYPDGDIVNYNYNGLFLNKVYKDSNTTYAHYSGYNALGQQGRITFGNGVTTDYAYKPNNFRLHSIFTIDPALNQCFQSLSYNYDSVGNVKDIFDYRDPEALSPICGGNPGANSQSFVYDALDRLAQATGPYGVSNYSYDQIGNMMSNAQAGGFVFPTGPTSGNYTYPPSGPTSVRPHAVTGVYSPELQESRQYQYDSNGNMISDSYGTYTYNFENRLVKYSSPNGPTTIAFTYDGDGGRVRKTEEFGSNGSATVYIGKLYECAGTCSKYIFAGTQRIALKPVGTNYFFYYHPDHLGSTNSVTNQGGCCSGSVIEQSEQTYYPYGLTRTDEFVSVHHQYTSQELDGSTGLYFYNARYYDPALGRFTQPDTIVPDPTDPQALNRYSYVRNNPINYIDPTGHRWGTLDRIADRGRKFVENQVNAAQENPQVAGTVMIVVGAAGATATAFLAPGCVPCWQASATTMAVGVDVYNNEPARGGSIGVSTSGEGQFDIWTGMPGTSSSGDVFGNRATVATITSGATNIAGETSLFLAHGGIATTPVLLAPCPGGDLDACASAYGSIGPGIIIGGPSKAMIMQFEGTVKFFV